MLLSQPVALKSDTSSGQQSRRAWGERTSTQVPGTAEGRSERSGRSSPARHPPVRGSAAVPPGEAPSPCTAVSEAAASRSLGPASRGAAIPSPPPQRRGPTRASRAAPCPPRWAAAPAAAAGHPAQHSTRLAPPHQAARNGHSVGGWSPPSRPTTPGAHLLQSGPTISSRTPPGGARSAPPGTATRVHHTSVHSRARNSDDPRASPGGSSAAPGRRRRTAPQDSGRGRPRGGGWRQRAPCRRRV